MVVSAQVGTTCVPGPSDPPSSSPTTLEPTQAPTSCEDVLASCKDDPTFAYQGDRRKTCGWIYHKKPSFCARDDVVQSCPYAAVRRGNPKRGRVESPSTAGRPRRPSAGHVDAAASGASTPRISSNFP